MPFLAIGSTTRESGYGMSLSPIPLPTLEQTMQILLDINDITVSIKFDSESPLKQNEMYAITRIQDRISLLLSLAQKDGFVAKELQRDQVDLLKESLLQLPTPDPFNITPVTTIKPCRRTRTAMAIAVAFMGLASFGTSMLNTAQMAQLKSDIDQTSENQKLIIEELKEQDLRIHNITQFIMISFPSGKVKWENLLLWLRNKRWII